MPEPTRSFGRSTVESVFVLSLCLFFPSSVRHRRRHHIIVMAVNRRPLLDHWQPKSALLLLVLPVVRHRLVVRRPRGRGVAHGRGQLVSRTGCRRVRQHPGFFPLSFSTTFGYPKCCLSSPLRQLLHHSFFAFIIDVTLIEQKVRQLRSCVVSVHHLILTHCPFSQENAAAEQNLINAELVHPVGPSEIHVVSARTMVAVPLSVHHYSEDTQEFVVFDRRNSVDGPAARLAASGELLEYLFNCRLSREEGRTTPIGCGKARDRRRHGELVMALNVR